MLLDKADDHGTSPVPWLLRTQTRNKGREPSFQAGWAEAGSEVLGRVTRKR